MDSWLLLLIVLVLLVLGVVWLRKTADHAPEQTAAREPIEPSPDSVPLAQHYKSDKVGNDAAARPWDRTDLAFEPTQQELELGNQLRPSADVEASLDAAADGLVQRPDQLPDRLPGQVDLSLLLERSKDGFMRLHNAWEQADALALQQVLSPKIWHYVEGAIASQTLPEWGQDLGEILHLTARALRAEPQSDGQYRVQLEFAGSQNKQGEVSNIHEVWDVCYREEPALWQISDLQGGRAAA